MSVPRSCPVCSRQACQVEENFMMFKVTPSCLTQNKRMAKSMAFSLSQSGVHGSRSCGVTRYDAEKFIQDGVALLAKFNTAPAHQAAW